LAVEDAVQAHERPKREQYGDVLAVALKTLEYDDTRSDIETGEMMVFLGPRFALTVRHGNADPAREAAGRLADALQMVRFGPVAVLHAVLDVVVDAYSAIAIEVRADLTALERRVFSIAREDLTEEVHSLKREVLEFRDAVQPLVPVVDDFAGPRASWPEGALPYFRDVADHLRHSDTEVRSLGDLIDSVLDAHLARVGTWQNDDMRRISAWAAVFALPTVLSGLLSIPFAHLSALPWAYGLPVVLVVMAGGCVGLHGVFRRNGWL
jgi:magnesium transporter